MPEINIQNGYTYKRLYKKFNKKKKIWLNIIEHYRKAFEILRSKQDLSFDQVKQFQLHVDLFYQDYLGLYERQGITNYFHLLGSGHVAQYLLSLGNLYVHSQQGWEAFNSFIKVYYFRRTNRGGGRGSDGNRIRQFARWQARRLIWNTGYSYEEITVGNVFNVNIGTSEIGVAQHNSENDGFTIHEYHDSVFEEDDSPFIENNSTSLPTIIDNSMNTYAGNGGTTCSSIDDASTDNNNLINMSFDSCVVIEEENQNKLILEYACNIDS